jgi:hypothetical protein
MRLGCFYILIAFSISIYGNVCTKRLTQNPQEMQSNIRMVDDRSQTNHRWHRTRGLKDYSKLLTVAIFNKLKNLKRGQWWFDMGAGGNLAQIGYHHGKEIEFDNTDFSEIPPGVASGKANTLAVGIKRPQFYLDANTPIDQLEKYLSQQIKEGRHLYIESFVEKLEIAHKAKLITDVQGPLTYTRDLRAVILKYLELLEDGGEILIFAQDATIHSEGKKLTIFEWLKKYLGAANVKRLSTGAIVVKKPKRPYYLPLLKLTYYLLEDTTMIREFEEVRKSHKRD